MKTKIKSEEKKKELQAFIARFSANVAKSKQATARKKMIDKLDVEEIEPSTRKYPGIVFKQEREVGDQVLTIDKLKLEQDGVVHFQDISFTVNKGDKIAFVGKNGEGKSTLAKMIVNELEFDGKIELGHQVKMGYYAQNQAEFLDENLTVLETIEQAATEDTSGRVRSILGSFLFSNDEVKKKVKVLSGGERARVALCKLLLEPYNLLIMDEPTNHLDITSKELLKKALAKYDGSLIVVSHDREFLQGLTEKVYEFKNQNIKEYIGDIDTFLEEKDLENFKQLESSQKEQKNTKQDKSDVQLSYAEQKAHQKKIKKLQNRVSKLEKEIETLDKFQKQIDADLAIPERFSELSQKDGFFAEYEKNQQKLQELEAEWEKAAVQLEAIK